MGVMASAAARRVDTIRPRAHVALLPAAYLVARTDVLGAGFDPAMRVGEDVDLVWLPVHEGRRVLHVAAVDVFHEARTGARDVLHRKPRLGDVLR